MNDVVITTNQSQNILRHNCSGENRISQKLVSEISLAVSGQL